jgi:hypothetical protein
MEICCLSNYIAIIQENMQIASYVWPYASGRRIGINFDILGYLR